MYNLYKSGIPIGSRPEQHSPNYMGTNEEPWYTRGAIEFLVTDVLQEFFEVLEYGCGSSTAWFHSRVKSVTAIEHDSSWSGLVTDTISNLSPSNLKGQVNIINVPNSHTGQIKYRSVSDGRFYDEYVNRIHTLDKTFDLICVDGRCRTACIENSIRYIKNGGYLLIDNSERQRYAGAINALPSEWDRFDFVTPVDTTTIFKVRNEK